MLSTGVNITGTKNFIIPADFYGQILMYLIVHPCFYVCIVDIQQLPKDDRDSLKRVGILTNCV
jgi:hypothetical protein